MNVKDQLLSILNSLGINEKDYESLHNIDSLTYMTYMTA